jgi:hypothetical protein
MGIDVYVPRAGRAARAQADPAPAAEAGRAALPERPRVMLLARARNAGARALLAQVARALAFARVDVAVTDAVGAGAIGDTAGLVAFGEPLAREAGAAWPAGRQNAMPWVVAADIGELGASASAKRALWGELRRMLRALKAGRRGEG